MGKFYFHYLKDENEEYRSTESPFFKRYNKRNIPFPAFRMNNSNNIQFVSPNILKKVHFFRKQFNLENEYASTISAFVPQEDGIYRLTASIELQLNDIRGGNIQTLFLVNDTLIKKTHQAFSHENVSNIIRIIENLQLNRFDRVQVAIKSSVAGVIQDTPNTYFLGEKVSSHSLQIKKEEKKHTARKKPSSISRGKKKKKTKDFKEYTVIGKGRDGVVYQLMPDRCVKVFFKKETQKKELKAIQIGQSSSIIPRLYDYGEDYIVMEYIKGISLAKYLKKNRHMTKSLVIKIINLLDELRSLNFSRQDTELRHVLINEEGNLKIIDHKRAFTSNRSIPIKLLTELKELKLSKDFLAYVKEIRPSIYEKWKKYG